MGGTGIASGRNSTMNGSDFSPTDALGLAAWFALADANAAVCVGTGGARLRSLYGRSRNSTLWRKERSGPLLSCQHRQMSLCGPEIDVAGAREGGSRHGCRS